jgi:predicted phage terminase large subunit-like protein
LTSGRNSRNEEDSDLIFRAAARASLIAFTEYLGYANASYHEEIYKILQHPEVKRGIIILPPGHGKSTSSTINYPLWKLGRDQDLRFIIASHTRDFVASFVREITGWMAHPRYVRIFGDLKPTFPNKWSQHEIIVTRAPEARPQKDPSITAVGVEQAVIGRRANEIICDDIIDETWASSETLRRRVVTWFKKELLERLEPDGRLFVVGTRWDYLDFYGLLLEEWPSVWPQISPDGCTQLILPAIDEANNPLWETRWPLSALLDKKREVGPIMWSCQYLHNPSPIEGTDLKKEWLHYWDPLIDEPAKKIYRLPNRDEMLTFQGWDLGISESETAHPTVGLTLGITKEGRAFVLDYESKTLDFPAQVAAVESLALAWKPEKIGIEAVAYQRALPQWVKRGLFPVIAVEQTRNKMLRILSLAPYFQNGTLCIARTGQDELQMEYLHFPKGRNDILDALEIAFRITRTYLKPGATLFEPPSAYRDYRREEDRDRFSRGRRP